MSTSDNPEEKYKTLINIGIGLSILIIVGIFVTIGVTKAKIADRLQPDEDEIERLRDSIIMADMMSVETHDDYYDDPGDYYQSGPYPLESENDSLRDLIRNGYYATTYQQELLDHLETETDRCAKLIRDLQSDLGDTMSIPGVSGAQVSIDFFSRTERDEALFSALFAYRETAEELAEDAGVYDIVSYRDYFPLRETSSYGYVHSWDESEFEQDPVEVMTFLKNLEMDLRHYENQVLWDIWY